MTTAPLTPTPRKRRRLFLLLALSLLFAGGVVGYFKLRPRPTPIPAVSTDGLDAPVVAAINKARAELEANPKSAAAWGRLGMVLFAQDKDAEAAPFFAEAERLDSRDARWPYFRGLALIRLESPEGIPSLKRAAAIPPSSFFIRLRLAEEYLKREQLDDAASIFGELLTEQPDHARVLLGRGQIYFRLGKYADALSPLKQAAEHPTAQRAARDALAQIYARQGKTSEAEAERKRAATAPADRDWPDPYLAEASIWRLGLQARVDQTRNLLGNGEVNEALKEIMDVLEFYPESDEAHLTLGRVLMRTGAIGEAEKALLQAITLNPQLVDGHFRLAEAKVLQQDFVAAEKRFQRTIELKPTHALAHYNLGHCRLKQGNKAGAITAFGDAVRVSPDLAAAQLELGALLLQEGKLDEAIKHLDNALRLDEKNERARTLLTQARTSKKP